MPANNRWDLIRHLKGLKITINYTIYLYLVQQFKFFERRE